MRFALALLMLTGCASFRYDNFKNRGKYEIGSPKKIYFTMRFTDPPKEKTDKWVKEAKDIISAGGFELVPAEKADEIWKFVFKKESIVGPRFHNGLAFLYVIWPIGQYETFRGALTKFDRSGKCLGRTEGISRMNTFYHVTMIVLTPFLWPWSRERELRRTLVQHLLANDTPVDGCEV